MSAISSREPYVVAQAEHGGWLVLDEDSVTRGLFTTKTDAMLFACMDEAHKPRAVVLLPDRVKIWHRGDVEDRRGRTE